MQIQDLHHHPIQAIKHFWGNHHSQIEHGAENAAKFAGPIAAKAGWDALKVGEDAALEELRFGDRIKNYYNNHKSQIEHGAESAAKFAGPIAAKAGYDALRVGEDVDLEELRFGRVKKFWGNHKSQIEHGAEDAAHLAPLLAFAALDLEELRFGSRIENFYNKNKKTIDEVGKVALHVAPLAALAFEEQQIMLI